MMALTKNLSIEIGKHELASLDSIIDIKDFFIKTRNEEV